MVFLERLLKGRACPLEREAAERVPISRSSAGVFFFFFFAKKKKNSVFDRPAAAVIPAPIAYIKVVAVKKLVVEVWSRTLGLLNCMYLTVRDFLLGERPPSGGPEPGLLL